MDTRKIPVGQTIAESYGFIIRNYFTLLGILWLPAVIMIAVSFLFMRQMSAVLASQMAHEGQLANPLASLQMLPLTMLVNVLNIALVVIMIIGIAREAMGLRTGPRFVYLRFGADELRAVGGILLLLVMLYAALLVAVIIGIILAAAFVAVPAASGGAQAHPNPLALGLQVAGIVGGIAILILIIGAYFGLRLGFLLIPVTVAEQRIGLWRSWELTKGNFWRSFAVAFVASLPIIVVELVFGIVVLGTFYSGLFSHLGDAKGMTEYLREAQQNMMQSQLRYMPYIWAAGFLVSPIIYGLSVLPGVFAYRALVPQADETSARHFD